MGFVNMIFFTVPKRVHFTLVGAKIFAFILLTFKTLRLIHVIAGSLIKVIMLLSATITFI